MTRTSTRSPELLAEHADALLHKNNKMAEEEDLEVLALYEAEVSMISKLKETCGFEYMNKFQCMFTDMSPGKDLTDNFKERMQQNHKDMDITFSIIVLSTNFWPLDPPTHDFIIPQGILPTYACFSQYYQQKHSRRKLMWLWNYSKNELCTNYLNQKYILIMSSWQMAVLLQYNNNDTLSLEELMNATVISKDILKQVLAVLIKAKILINEEGFKWKKICINLKIPIKTVDKDRKYIIQATIIRVIKQVSQRLTPKIPDIKAIDHLLEKEYIERVEGTRDMFSYIV
ncbi:hypothetical protein V8D89_005955 [Ganoderma adspersum]